MANGIINFYTNSDYSKHFSRESRDLFQFKLEKNSLSNKLNKIKKVDSKLLTKFIDELQIAENAEKLKEGSFFE